MKKKIMKALSVMLAVVLTLTAAPLSGFVGLELPDWLDFSIMSKAAETSGTCGDNLTWNFDESTSTLTISGTGIMYDYGKYNRPWEDYEDIIKNVVFDNEVTSIGKYAFYSFKVFSTIEIPDSITTIGGYSFYDCNNLTTITIPSSVATIGDYAFSSCNKLTDISVDSNNKYYSSESGVLFNKDKTALIQYPIGNTIANYKIPDNVTTIGKGAFRNCNRLIKISTECVDNENGLALTISDTANLKIINTEAFRECTNLECVTIPKNVETIGDYAFYYCDSLLSAKIGENVKTIGYRAFMCCTKLCKDSPDSPNKLTIPESVEVIGAEAFSDCWELTEINLSKNIKTINSQTFACCGLTGIDIPEGVTSIRYHAFGSCTKLKQITIPTSIETIGQYAFFNCKSLTTVTYAGAEEDWLNISIGKSNEDLLDAKINFDPSTKETYYIRGLEFDYNIDDILGDKDTSSKDYNPKLSYLLGALSYAVYDDREIRVAYQELEYDNQYGVYDYQTNPISDDSCAYMLGFNNSKDTCLITIRGSGSVEDWINNFDISTDDDGKHLGFERAAEKIYKKLQEEIEKIVLEENSNTTILDKIKATKFVITGHSRGAAVANLLSVKLMEEGSDLDNVYNYNFACPDVAFKKWCNDYDNGVMFSSESDKYTNIFNLCNRGDLVPYVPGPILSVVIPGKSWGRYGKTIWFTQLNDEDSDLVQTTQIILPPSRMLFNHDMKVYLKQLENCPDVTNEEAWGDAGTHVRYDVTGYIAKILCPVDVIITNEDGTRVASVINGEINYYDSEFGDVIISTEGDKKLIYINGEMKFNVELIGTDTGTMTYSIDRCDILNNEVFDSKTFSSVTLEKGKTMYSPVSEAEETNDIQLFVTEEKDGERVYTNIINEDGTEEKYYNYSFSIQSPSRTEIRNKDGIILHANVEGNAPNGSYVKWESSNSYFDTSADGSNLKIIAKNKGYTTFTAILCDADGNELARDSVEMYSKSGFFDKIGGFFRSLFGTTKIYEN